MRSSLVKALALEIGDIKSPEDMFIHRCTIGVKTSTLESLCRVLGIGTDKGNGAIAPIPAPVRAGVHLRSV